MSGFTVVIPARYHSSRLPGKPLLDLGGKTLIRRVYECAKRSHADTVIVATDDSRIAEEVTAFGGIAEMTSTDHRSGSDRIGEVIDKRQIPDDQVVVNVQGDEPFIPATLINELAGMLEQSPGTGMATICHPVSSEKEAQDPNVVKVVRDREDYALYFSRHAIPYIRSGTRREQMMRHIGVYAYRAGFLRKFVAMPVCTLEEEEQLEQLRALYNGERILVRESAELPGPGIDTEDDLANARACLAGEE